MQGAGQQTGAMAACSGGSVADWGKEQAVERTWNISRMVVTLEVSKLSGRLNNDARCRESNGGHTVWCEVQSTGRPEAAGDRDARNVQGEGPPADTRYYREAGQGGERTQNMPRMSVTLEVSKLSGWSNADAP